MEKAQCLAAVPIFFDMPEPVLNRLAEQAGIRRLDRGAILFHRGDAGDALYVILSGIVKVYQMDSNGRQHTLAILEENDFFGEMAIFDGAPRSATAEALTDITVLILRREAVLNCVRENPETAVTLLATLSSRLRQANIQLERFLGRDVKSRVAGVLLDMVRDFSTSGGDGELIHLPLTHQELANLAGTSRETITRTLCEWQDAGIIAFDGRRMRVRDRDALMRINQ